MFLVVNAKGKYWNGLAWTEQGKEFFSRAAAARSLHEEGEELEGNLIVETIRDPT